MTKKQTWLDLAEYFSVGGFFFGVITTALTKQILFSLIPLTFVLFFNTINRQKFNYKFDLVLEQSQNTKQLYQSHKLEQEKLIAELKTEIIEIKQLTNSQDNEHIDSTLNKFSQELISLKENYQSYQLEQEKLIAELKTEIVEIKQLTNSQDNKDIDSTLNKFSQELISLKENYQSYQLEQEKLIAELKTEIVEIKQLTNSQDNKDIDSINNTLSFIKSKINNLSNSIDTISSDYNLIFPRLSTLESNKSEQVKLIVQLGKEVLEIKEQINSQHNQENYTNYNNQKNDQTEDENSPLRTIDEGLRSINKGVQGIGDIFKLKDK